MASEMFDTLAFSKRLQAGDVPANQADAHASAQADLVIAYLLGQVATKEDLKVFATAAEALCDQGGLEGLTKDDLKAFATKDDLKAFATKDDLKAFATKDDLKRFATKDDLKRFATKEDLNDFATKKDLANLAEKMTARMDKMVTEEKLLLLLELRDKKMTIRLGGMIFAAVAAASALMQFMGGIAGG